MNLTSLSEIMKSFDCCGRVLKKSDLVRPLRAAFMLMTPSRPPPQFQGNRLGLLSG